MLDHRLITSMSLLNIIQSVITFANDCLKLCLFDEFIPNIPNFCSAAHTHPVDMLL